MNVIAFAPSPNPISQSPTVSAYPQFTQANHDTLFERSFHASNSIAFMTSVPPPFPFQEMERQFDVGKVPLLTVINDLNIH
jgi:hypothetical protein